MQNAPIQITDEEFLRGIFGDHWYRAAMVSSRQVDGFAQHYWQEVQEGVYPWREGAQEERYYCISIHRPGDDGRASREISRYLGAAVLVVDDVREKIDPEKFRHWPEPTYKLITSPGSEQWGWALPYLAHDASNAEPVERVAAFAAGVIAQYFDGVDPGMAGANRVCKLPSASNLKEHKRLADGSYFRAQLVHWRPELRYSLDQMFSAAGISPAEYLARKSGSTTEWDDESPLGREIEVAGWANNGAAKIRCPFEDAHTTHHDDGQSMAVSVFADGGAVGTCHHSCGQLANKALFDALEEANNLEPGFWSRQKGYYAVKELTRAAEANRVNAGGPPKPGTVTSEMQPAPGGKGPSAPVDFLKPRDAQNGQAHAHNGQARLEDAPAPGYSSLELAVADMQIRDASQIENAVRVLMMQGNDLSKAAVRDVVASGLSAHLPGIAISAIRSDVNKAWGKVKREDQAARRVGDPFEHWVYVSGMDKFVDRRNGNLIIPRAFDLVIGGPENHFPDPMNPDNPAGLSPTRAFQMQPESTKEERVVDGIIWTPAPVGRSAAIVYRDGLKLFNVYQAPRVDLVDVSTPSPGLQGYLWMVNHICGDQAHLFLQHLAFTLQRPEVKINWQWLIYGKARTGKSYITAPLVYILGDSCKKVDAEKLVKNPSGYDDFYYQAKAVIIEEVYQPGNLGFYNSLKSKLANDDTETLNLKGRGMVRQDNRYSVYMYSNHDDALHFEEDDLKLMVVRAPDDYAGYKTLDESRAWFHAQWEWLRAGGYKEVYSYLMQLDVSTFPKGQVPVITDAYKAMSRASRPDWEHAIEEAVEERTYPFNKLAFRLMDVEIFLSNLPGMRRPPGMKKISAALRGFGFEAYEGQKKTSGVKQKVRFWARPGLNKEMTAVELWDFYHKHNPTGG